MRLSTHLFLAISFAVLSAAAIAGHFLLPPSLEPALPLAALLPAVALAYALGQDRGKRSTGTSVEAMSRQLAELARDRNTAGLTIASRHLFDGHPVPMYVYDQASLRFLEVNDSAVAQYGYGRERFLGMTIEDIRSPEEAARRGALPMGMTLADGSVGVSEHRKADGTVIAVEIIRRSMLFGDHPAMLVAAIDVTQAYRLERELRDSRTRLEALAGNLSGIVYQCRLTTSGEISYPYCSAAVSELLGTAPDGADFVTVTRAILPEDRPAFTASVRQSAAELSPWLLDFRCRRRDGTIAWFSGKGKPRRLANGDTLWDSVLIDVTEQKNAEQALRESEAQLRRSRGHLARAQRTANIGSWEVDLYSRSLTWSDELFRVLGLSRERVTPSLDLLISCFCAEDRERMRDWLELACAGATVPASEGRLLLPNGQERWVRLDAAVLRDAAAEAEIIVGTVEVVTQRKLAELELRDSQQHLARAQRMAAVGSMEIDYRTGTWKWTDELYRLLGIDKTVAPSAELYCSLLPEALRERFVASVEAIRLGCPQEQRETTLRRPDGQVRTFEVDIDGLADETGRVISGMATLHDVTALRAEQQRNAELEAQLHHAQRMEALGTLAGGIAHDLNNTLLPVMVLADALRRKLPAGSPEAERLELIRQAGNRARGLVRQVLAFSRREDPNKMVLDLAALVRQSMSHVRADVPTTVRIDEQIDKVAPVLGDAGQLHQVLVNLIANAIDAIGDSIGTITLALKNEARSETGAVVGPCVHFSVADTGCGMDEATLKRIFEPFFTTKAVGQGTGLGLSVVHGIVTSHGGRIEATSRRGEGTRFDIFLPALGAEHTMNNKEIAA